MGPAYRAQAYRQKKNLNKTKTGPIKWVVDMVEISPRKKSCKVCPRSRQALSRPVEALNRLIGPDGVLNSHIEGIVELSDSFQIQTNFTQRVPYA